MMEDFRLKVFMLVVELGSFTGAAKALKISQPAVSQNISELEKMVGCPLIGRGGGADNLTDEGRILFEYAKNISYWYSRINSELVEKTSKAPETREIELPDGRKAGIYADGDKLVIKMS